MYKYILLIGVFLFTASTGAVAAISPPRVIGATTVDTMLVMRLFEKKVPFIDVRSAEKYQAGHIPGAINLPLDDLTEETLEKLVKKNKNVVFYCTGVTCLASSQAVQKALDWGWTSVFYYRDGVTGWKRAGLQVE